MEKEGVDNVEKSMHMKKALKIKACLFFGGKKPHGSHKVMHKLSTKCG